MMVVACAGVLATSALARSQEQGTADELAHRHFESGAAYLQESDYDNARKEFQRAYDLSKRPAILLNLATVEERAGNVDAAISALEQYLAAEPQGEHAETARLRLANLQKRKAQVGADAGTTAEPSPDGGAAAPPGDAGAAPAPVAAPSLPPPEAKSEANIPAYVLLGIGGVSAVAAAVTGYLADSEWRHARDTCSPHCSDTELSSGRTLAWTSTALTGVAVVGVGVGLTLLLTSGGH
jgi:tetratricopeptide (TPR) repeat protein